MQEPQAQGVSEAHQQPRTGREAVLMLQPTAVEEEEPGLDDCFNLL